MIGCTAVEMCSFIRLVQARALVLLACLAGGGCGGAKSPQVVLYSSVDAEYAQAVCASFRQQTGIEVKLVSDTEEAKSTGLVNRLLAEKTRPQADVFWSGDAMRAVRVQGAGVAAADQPAGAPAGGGMAAGLPVSAGRLRLIFINDRAAGDGAARPKDVSDLARPEFAPRSCLANPLFGTTSMHMAALAQRWGGERVRQFLQEFQRHGGRMVASNGEVRRRVAAGEFAFGLTDSDDVAVALADAKPVSFIVPDQEGDGAVLVPCAALLIAGAPHPTEARRLVEFLTSAATESRLAASTASYFPLRPELPGPKVFGVTLGDVRLMPIQYAALPAAYDQALEGFLRQWVEDQVR